MVLDALGVGKACLDLSFLGFLITILVGYICDAASTTRRFDMEESVAPEPHQCFKRAPVLSSPFRFREGALALRIKILCSNDSYLLKPGLSHS